MSQTVITHNIIQTIRDDRADMTLSDNACTICLKSYSATGLKLVLYELKMIAIEK